jgi:hypothetical protein
MIGSFLHDADSLHFLRVSYFLIKIETLRTLAVSILGIEAICQARPARNPSSVRRV